MDGERAGAVVAAGLVRVSADPVRVGVPRAAGGRGEPTVQLIREDGVIRAIDVTCPCGERIRVVCEYAE